MEWFLKRQGKISFKASKKQTITHTKKPNLDKISDLFSVIKKCWNKLNEFINCVDAGRCAII